MAIKALSIVLSVCTVCIAILWGAHWYAERAMREKIQVHAERAGVLITVDQVLVEIGHPIRLRGITVADKLDGVTMCTIERIDTDLTLFNVVQGKRRPSWIQIEGVDADLSTPKRLLDAVMRYRSQTTPADTTTTRTRPTLVWSDVTVQLPHTVYDIPESLHLAHGRAIPDTDDPKGWWIETKGLDDQDRTVSTSLRLRPSTDHHEVGLSFQPPLRIRVIPPVDGASGTRPTNTMVASIGGLHYEHNKALRARDVTIELPQVANTRFAVDYVAIEQSADEPFLSGAVQLRVRGVTARLDEYELNAKAAELQWKKGPRNRLINRLQRLVFHSLTASLPQNRLSIQAQQVRVNTHGMNGLQSLKDIESIEVIGANVAMALPTPEQGQGIPYYNEIQSFLLGDRSGQFGGGPTQESPPHTETTRSAFTSALPIVLVHDSTLALLADKMGNPAVVLEQFGGIFEPHDVPGSSHIRLGGQLRDVVTGQEGPFAVDIITTKDGALKRARVKLAGSKLAVFVASKLSDSVRLTDQSNLSVDLDITPHEAHSGLSLKGTVALRNMGFLAPRIHAKPIDGLQITAELAADIDFEAHKLTVEAPLMEVADGRAAARLSATVDHLDHALPRLDVKLTIPRQRCQDLLGAIPPTMIQRLDGLEVSGSADGHLHFTVDLEKPRAFRYDIEVNMEGCKPRVYGHTDVTKLNRRFVHEVIEKSAPTGILVGPETDHYRSLYDIPRFIQMAALWTEDHSFFSHSGFRPSLIRRAIILNLERGRYVYGGSTISQQLVKNLFLSREKTLSRKLEEAIIVWLMERTVTKKRILELYLNCIEYGPSLYGIQNASQKYFSKNVDQLTPLEGAFLMGLKPYPRAGWRQYKRGHLDQWWIRRVRKILEGMAKKGWITKDQLETSRPFQLTFGGPDTADEDGTDDIPTPPPMPNDG